MNNSILQTTVDAVTKDIVPFTFKGISKQEYSYDGALTRVLYTHALEEVLTIMDLEGYSSSNAYRLGLWLLASERIESQGEKPLSDEEIKQELNLDDVSFRDALRKLTNRTLKWNTNAFQISEVA